MKQNCQKVFSLEALHSFFEQNICRCLQFHHGGNTRALLKRYAFMVRNKVNGLDMYIDTIADLDLFLQYTGRLFPAYFDFDIYSTNDNFALFTDLPRTWQNQIVYNTNEIESVSDSGAVILKPVYPSNKQQEVLATVRIGFEEILRYRRDPNAASFQIVFRARATQWRYYIVNRSHTRLEWPAINGKNDIRFDGPANVHIPDGEEALLFTSGDILLPVSEVPAYSFNLVNRTSASEVPAAIPGGEVVYKGLPVPSPSDIDFAQDNNNIFSSPMYVYI